MNYQGKLSSASTGRFAALRLPLALVLAELNVTSSRATAAAGPSMSISSSKSDMIVCFLVEEWNGLR